MDSLRIVIGTDGSAVALAAARRAHRLLPRPAHVVVLSVLGVTPLALASTGGAGARAGDVHGAAATGAHDALRQSAEDAIDDAIEVLDGWPIETRVEVGDPGSVICDVAAEHGADVVVVGATGRGLVRRLFLGSISAHVVRNAPCPVLVVAGSA